MKRIVLCFDGTWDKPASDTNVYQFWKSVLPAGSDGIGQQTWYNEGVGSSLADKLPGGLFGWGIDEHIQAGYRYLASNYVDGDEVYVLGFSRGAYTARSLVGLIRNCGLVTPRFLDEKIGVAYGIYRTRDDGPDSLAARAFRFAFSREIRIDFVGVWDTVGALGIPQSLAMGADAALYQFHDTELSGIVDRAFHAIALDEQRKDFAVCLWDPKAKVGQTLEQRWFAGDHSDVGGGNPDPRLASMTLRWMQDRAGEAGLGVNSIVITDQDFEGPVSDSYSTFLNFLRPLEVAYEDVSPRYFRPVLQTAFGDELLDPSINRRRSDASLDYNPENPGLPALSG